jgi:hypothetical protein
METNQQFCPICNSEVTYFRRYPKYVCKDCYCKTTDKDGRKVAFGNENIFGMGCVGHYLDTGEKYNSNICYIDGQECVAEEARFGGIVIEKK